MQKAYLGEKVTEAVITCTGILHRQPEVRQQRMQASIAGLECYRESSMSRRQLRLAYGLDKG